MTELPETPVRRIGSDLLRTEPQLLGPDGRPAVRNHRIPFLRDYKGFKCIVERVSYDAWTEPFGYLPQEWPAQALMYYCIHVAKAIEDAKANMRYVGEPMDVLNARAIFLSVCELYDVKPDDAVKFWPAIDKQGKKLGLTDDAVLPHWVKFPMRDNVQMQER